MLEIRTYTLASAEALDQYASVHWKRHIPSLAAHGITTHHVWREVAADVPRLVALVEYDNGADPAEATKTFMHSAEFAADMAGFDPSGIVDVRSVFVEPAPADPSRSDSAHR